MDEQLCKGSLFQCRDTVCSILCMQNCSYRSDTEEKEHDVRSEVTEFRNEQVAKADCECPLYIQKNIGKERAAEKNGRLDCDFHGSRDAYPAGL